MEDGEDEVVQHSTPLGCVELRNVGWVFVYLFLGRFSLSDNYNINSTLFVADEVLILDGVQAGAGGEDVASKGARARDSVSN